MYNKPLDIAIDNAIKQLKDWCDKNYNNEPKFSLCLYGVVMNRLKNHLKQSNNIHFNTWRNLNSLIQTKNLIIKFNSEGITKIEFLPRYSRDENVIKELNKEIANAIKNNNGITFKMEDNYVNLSSEKIIEKIKNYKFN